MRLLKVVGSGVTTVCVATRVVILTTINILPKPPYQTLLMIENFASLIVSFILNPTSWVSTEDETSDLVVHKNKEGEWQCG